MVTDRSIREQALKSSGRIRQTPTAPCHPWDTMRAFDRSNARRSWWKNELAHALEIKRTLIHSNQSSLCPFFCTVPQLPRPIHRIPRHRHFEKRRLAGMESLVEVVGCMVNQRPQCAPRRLAL